jgi:hypothetical protein
MKKIALISSHCDTEDKIEVLNSNIKILKSLNIDTFVISSIKIEIDCDFLFITKENPILKWPEKAIALWKSFPYDSEMLKVISFVDDYGWASLYQIKKIMEFATTYDYDIFYFLIYDLKIDEKIIEDIKSNIYNIIYPRKDFNSNKIYPSSFHFSIFNKEKLKLISSLIDKNSYKNMSGGFAEDFVHQCVTAVGLQHSEHVVIDLIHITDKNKLLNHSKSKKYELFLSKNEESDFKMFLYNLTENCKVYINQEIHELNQNKLIETNINPKNLNLLRIDTDQESIDYIETYNKIGVSLIRFM